MRELGDGKKSGFVLLCGSNGVGFVREGPQSPHSCSVRFCLPAGFAPRHTYHNSITCAVNLRVAAVGEKQKYPHPTPFFFFFFKLYCAN